MRGIALLVPVLMAVVLSALMTTNAMSGGADGPPAVPETSGGWVKYAGNPVLGGAYGTCFDVSVLKDGDTYRMWFSWRPKRSLALVEAAYESSRRRETVSL